MAQLLFNLITDLLYFNSLLTYWSSFGVTARPASRASCRMSFQMKMSPKRWRQSSNRNERRWCLVVSSLKALRRDCHLNVPRKGLPVADGLRPLVLGSPDRWSDDGSFSIILEIVASCN